MSPAPGSRGRQRDLRRACSTSRPRRARTVSSRMSMRTCRIPSTSRTVNSAMRAPLMTCGSSQTIVRSQSSCSGSGIEPALAAQRVVERHDDEQDHPEEERGDRAEDELLEEAASAASRSSTRLIAAPTSTAYQSTFGISVITPVSRCCRASAKSWKAAMVSAWMISWPVVCGLEARQPLADRVGAVGAAVQELALPVRRPVAMDGEEQCSRAASPSRPSGSARDSSTCRHRARRARSPRSGSPA